MGLSLEGEAGHTCLVYGLADPRNGELFYIGSTTNLNLPSRLLSHRYNADSSARPRVQELAKLGLAPDVRRYGTHDTKAAAWAEEYGLIAQHPKLANRSRSLECAPGCACAKHDRTKFLGNATRSAQPWFEFAA